MAKTIRTSVHVVVKLAFDSPNVYGSVGERIGEVVELEEGEDKKTVRKELRAKLEKEALRACLDFKAKYDTPELGKARPPKSSSK